MTWKTQMQKPSVIALMGTLSAVTFLATSINFPLFGAQGGLVHLGTLASSLICLLFGPLIGMVSSTIGMTLFDLVFFPIWAPATFVIRLVSSYVMGHMGYKKTTLWGYQLRALLVGNSLIVLGYFIAGYFIWGNWENPILTLSGDVLTASFSIIAASILLPLLTRRALPNLDK